MTASTRDDGRASTGTDERGVSPVVGVILMVAIVVILAAVIGTYVIGIGDQQEPGPTVSTSTEELNASDESVTFYHDGGDDVDISEIRIVVRANGKTGRLVDLPVDGSLGAGNIRGTDMFDEGATGVQGGVLDTSVGDTDGTWSAGDKIEFEICCAVSLSAGDEVEVQIVHEPSGEIVVEKTFSVQG